MDCPIPFVKLIKYKRFPELNHNNFEGLPSKAKDKFLYGYILVNVISPYTGSHDCRILYYNGNSSNPVDRLITYKFTAKSTAMLSRIEINITKEVYSHKIVSIIVIDSYHKEEELLVDNTLFGTHIYSLSIHSNTNDTLVNIDINTMITQELIDEYSVFKHTKLVKLT